MDQLQHPQQQPPPYVSHNPAELNLPSVPRHDIPTPLPQSDITLPDLKTVLSRDFDPVTSPVSSFGRQKSPSSVRSLPPIDPGPGYANGQGSVTRDSMESAIVSPSEVGSSMSVDGARSTSAVSMDDEKVRIAAEALSGLGNPGFSRSPPNSASFSRGAERDSFHRTANGEDAEPLLQLFAKAHPWVGGTINGSLNAYSTTKQYSPRFVQYGANLVERNITTPVVSTVSTVGRMTGVESGLRWYYGGAPNAARPRDLEEGGGASATFFGPADPIALPPEQLGTITGLTQDALDRLEPLPVYRASKPPSYREEASPSVSNRNMRRPAHNRSWSSQVFVMTSGLGVALSDTSRRSLVYCLNVLSQAAEHVHIVMDALRMVLEQYDRARSQWQEQQQQQSHAADEKAREAGLDIESQDQHQQHQQERRPANPADHDEAARQLAALIKKHSDDIWNTLKHVVTYISNSAGGALPENARQFVRTQLMSLPQRWRFVSDETNGGPESVAQNGIDNEKRVGGGDAARTTSSPNATQDFGSETSRGAHRMIAFATEGLDMMAQVSQTMKLTLDSAEKWLARVGQGQAQGQSQQQQQQQQHGYQHYAAGSGQNGFESSNSKASGSFSSADGNTAPAVAESTPAQPHAREMKTQETGADVEMSG